MHKVPFVIPGRGGINITVWIDVADSQHDILVDSFTDFEKKSVPIPERPITYVYEHDPFEDMIKRIFEESPIQKAERALREYYDSVAKYGYGH